jgi:predicted ATPase
LLTRLTVRGFKTLLDVDLRFGPFTCIVGENAVGKSNLFDAIRFLHLLANHPIPEAVAQIREARGRSVRPGDLFSSLGEMRVADEIRLAAEMIAPRTATDEFGVTGAASITVVRYEVAFVLDHTDERLVLRDESLRPVTLMAARKVVGAWAQKPFVDATISGARHGGPFISTQGDIIHLHQDGHGGRKVPAAKSSRTVLSSVNADFPTALAARREMESWSTLQLEPSAMRAPSFYTDPKKIDERGAFLPGALSRLAKTRGPSALAEIVNRVAGLVPDVRELRVEDDPRLETLTAQVMGSDRTFRPARALSDGTLRFLVLATIAADPEATGTLCVEEPENGIHPDRVGEMVSLLYDLAVSPIEAVGEDNPLRQVLVNSHSPLVYNEVKQDDLVFLELVDLVRDATRGRFAAVRVPSGTWRAESSDPVHLPVARARVSAWEQMSFRFRAADGR